MKNIQRDGAAIACQVMGTGEVTLLFVHGSYTDYNWWKDQVEFFKNDYKVVTLDLPGHGQSGTARKNWSLDGFAKDVVAVIDGLELHNVIVIGHSMGAAVCLMAAVAHPRPLIGFVAVEYFKNAGTPLPEPYQQQSKDIVAQLKNDFRNTNEQYARMALLTEKTSPAINKKVVEAYRNGYQPMGMATTPEIFEMYKLEQKLLPALPFKLYLINTDYTPTSREALQQYASNGYELVVMKGTSHFPMLENAPELNKLLYEMVQEISVNAFMAHNAYSAGG